MLLKWSKIELFRAVEEGMLANVESETPRAGNAQQPNNNA